MIPDHKSACRDAAGFDAEMHVAAAGQESEIRGKAGQNNIDFLHMVYMLTIS